MNYSDLTDYLLLNKLLVKDLLIELGEDPAETKSRAIYNQMLRFGKDPEAMVLILNALGRLTNSTHKIVWLEEKGNGEKFIRAEFKKPKIIVKRLD